MPAYGSADAADRWINQPNASAPRGMSADAADRWAQNERARRANPNRPPPPKAWASPRGGTSGANYGVSARQAEERARRATLQKKAQAALDAAHKDSLEYRSKRTGNFTDAVGYLSRKYGLDQAYLRDPRNRKVLMDEYGIGFDKGTGQPRGGLRYGERGVYLGSYKELIAPQGMSADAADQWAKPVDRDIIVTKKQAEGSIYGWSIERLKAFQKRNGLPSTGLVDKKTWSRWGEGVLQAGQYYSMRGERIDPDTYLTLKYGDKSGGGRRGGGRGGGRRGGGGGGGGGGGSSASRVTLTNRTELQRVLNQMFQDRLGRNATMPELDKFLGEVNRQERSNPQVATVSGDSTTVTGGIDPVQAAENYMLATMGGEVGTRIAGVDYFAAAMGLIGGN